MRKLFGTDGIRGLANREPITATTAMQIGRALGRQLRRNGASVAVIGRDTRRSGPMLEGALLAGLCSAGINVHSAGIVPTPAIAALTRALGAGAGIVVSASHNPFPDNGIKLFGPDGFKLADAQESEIEAELSAAGEDPIAEQIGAPQPIGDAVQRYVADLASTVPATFRLEPLEVVIDCANGAAYEAGPQLLRHFGARFTALAVEPNGININEGCGALHPERLQQEVRSRGAHLGIAVDGDADRLLLVDEHGDTVDGDDILGMLALDRLRRGNALPAVVGTVMSNLGLELTLRREGVELVRTAVGDRYVVEEMRRRGFVLGGESSGHLLLLEHSTTGDGLLGALQVLELMARTGEPLSGLRRAVSRCPQALVNVRVARRQDLAAIPAVQAAIAAIERALHDRGRVLVRYSGTEPLVRVMVEGEQQAEVQGHAEELAQVIRSSVGEA